MLNVNVMRPSSCPWYRIIFINDRVFQLWKGSIFLPLAFIDAQTPSLQKPVSALTPKKRFHDEVLKAKIRARSRSFFLRREQLKVEGRRRENELGAAELQELSEVRKGHQHSLPNMEIARIRATNKRHPFPIQDIQSKECHGMRISRFVKKVSHKRYSLPYGTPNLTQGRRVSVFNTYAAVKM